MPFPPVDQPMPRSSHRAMHWAARQAEERLEQWAEHHQHEDGTAMLRFLFMTCFAVGAVWRDTFTDDPMVLICPSEGPPCSN